MVFIDGVKYACATCIKGHRSTACQHSDRTLFVIKRKGRPITQCSHCRELRKTQKVHVKCNCNEKKEEELKTQAVAGLPQGIPVNIQSTDQDHIEYDDYRPFLGDKTSVEALLNPCQCLTGAKCICCRPNEKVSSDIKFTTSMSDINNNSVQTPTPMYTLPPIQIHSYDDAKGKNTSPFIPWGDYCNSEQNNSYTNSSFSNINSQNLQEDSCNHNPIESNYSLSYYYKDNIDLDHDQNEVLSEVLGEEICHSTSDDLANIIYSPFQGCSSSMADGSCCKSNNLTTMMSICRCGSGCKCQSCDTHAKKVNIGNSYNNVTFQQNQSSSSCCSSSHEIIQPEHTVIKDGDGVLLCGCGCQKLNTECSDCLGDLCEEYLLKQP